MKFKKIITVLGLCVCIQMAAFSADIAPAQLQGVMQQAGSINAQNADAIENLERKQEINKDFKNFEKQKKDLKNDNSKHSDVKKNKNKIKKAKIEEYATKGVYVENIEISPSEILTKDELQEIIDKYSGRNLKMDEIKSIADEINILYLQKGYVTAKAYVPEQTVIDEKIRIELVEGRVGEVNISNNRWTKDKYIRDRINSKSGSIFDIVTLEEDILNFNRYNNCVELAANLEPGKKKLGTTDINLTAREHFPFHASLIWDNAGRKTIGKQRAGIMLQHDSLLGYRDRLTLGAYVSSHSNSPFADYNIPVNKKDGRIGFMFSSSYAHIANGPYQMFNIRSRSYNYSLYFNQPIIRKPYMELSSLTSLNYKQATTSFDKHDLYTDKITAAQTGLNFRYDTKRGIWYLNQSAYYAFPIIQSDSNYLKLEGGILRLHDFGHGIVGQFRANYQVIPNRNVVPYIDQFQAGGIASVRGYSEGLLIGRSGYLVSGEVIFPILPSKINVKDKKTNEKKSKTFLGKFVKGAFFVDHAGVFPYKGSGPGADGYDANDLLLSVGMGLRINLPADITARLYWGFPCIRNSHETDRKSGGRFHFDIILTPDIDKILALRHPKDDSLVKKNTGDVKTASAAPSAVQTPPKRTVIKQLNNKNKNNRKLIFAAI